MPDIHEVDFQVNGVASPVECQWFAHCFNDATHVISHPVLDWVPACNYCVQFVRRNL